MMKERLLDQVKRNMSVLVNNMNMYLDVSKSAKSNSERVMEQVREIKNTFGQSMDGLTRKV